VLKSGVIRCNVIRTVQRIKPKSRWSTACARTSSCSRVWITFALGGHRILFRSYTSSVYFGSGTSVSTALLRYYHERERERERGGERNAQVTRPCARDSRLSLPVDPRKTYWILISCIRRRQQSANHRTWSM